MICARTSGDSDIIFADDKQEISTGASHSKEFVVVAEPVTGRGSSCGGNASTEALSTAANVACGGNASTATASQLPVTVKIQTLPGLKTLSFLHALGAPWTQQLKWVYQARVYRGWGNWAPEAEGTGLRGLGERIQSEAHSQPFKETE